MSDTIYTHLHFMQKNMHCPKKRTNKFAGYQYRNCEDIIESAKKILPVGCTLGISDEVVFIGDRYYVRASASFAFNGEVIIRHGLAREMLAKKGQDEPQITGTSSSYARKLALGGLLMIDDGVDADLTNTHEETPTAKPQAQIKKDLSVEELRAEIIKRWDNDKGYGKFVTGLLNDREKKLSDLDVKGLEYLLNVY